MINPDDATKPSERDPRQLLMKDSISSAKEDDFETMKANVVDLLKVEKKDKGDKSLKMN